MNHIYSFGILVIYYFFTFFPPFSDTEESLRHQQFQSCMKSLSTTRVSSFRALSILLAFLKQVANNSSKSKMNASTLSLIFAPVLFPLCDDPMRAANSDRTGVLEELIEHADLYFTK